MKYFLLDIHATQDLAKTLAPFLTPPFVLTLQGEIGSGKTTFVRALLSALGHQGHVKSPTFSIVESYPLFMKSEVFYHFDLYRMLADELEGIGFRDYFTPQAICCIEWPERAPQSIGSVDLAIVFELAGTGRTVQAVAGTVKGEQLLQHIES